MIAEEKVRTGGKVVLNGIKATVLIRFSIAALLSLSCPADALTDSSFAKQPVSQPAGPALTVAAPADLPAVVRENFHRWDLNHDGCSSHLKESGAKLMPAMIEHVSSMHGGQLADCSLCKTLMTLRSYTPSELRKMVRKVGSCDYQISLPGHARFIVKLPSKAEMTFNCTADQNCFWQDIINKACARLKPVDRTVAIRVLP